MNQQGAHRYEDRLLEFAYGELPAAEARSIETHVKGCSRCTGALREIEGVRRQMSQLAPEPAPDAGLDSLLAYAEQSARRAAAGPAPSGGGWRRWLFAAVGTASLAAVLVVVGVVANRPELAPASPAAIQKEEAKAQAQMRDQSAAAAPTPPADTAAAAAQPLAEGQAQDLEQAREKNKDGDKLVKDAVAANEAPPPPEAKVGRAVGKKEYDVQRVDVSSGPKTDEKKPLDPRLRESGNDRPDTMQNMVVGKGTRPVLPTTGTQGYARKTPPAADGEMVFPDTKTGHAAAPAPAKPAPSYRKAAPALTTAKKKASVGLGESGGGGTGRYDDGRIGSTSPAGPSRGKAGSKDDDSFDSLFGSGGGSKSSAGPTRGGGTVQPSAPATPPAQATRHEELQKMERAKAARMELDRSAESSAQRDRAPEPTSAPAGAPAPMAQAPSRNRSAPKSVAMNAPPPPVPSREVAAPSEAEDEAAPAQAQSASIPLSSSASSSRKAADVPPPSKVRTVNAQEMFLAATRARPGSPEEINGLIIAINAGLSGQYRIDALQRLCTQLDASGDSRAYDYCSAWASADPSSAVAMKRARAADDRWGPRARAKAAKKASEPAKAVDEAKPAAAY